MITARPLRLVPVVLALLVLPAGPALAQVFKCVDDKTGKISFSDTRCDTKSTGGRVEVKPNTMDTSGSREQIYRQQAREYQAAQKERAAAPWPEEDGYTDARVAERANSRECEQAKREHENEKVSIYRDDSVLDAKYRYMKEACGLPGSSPIQTASAAGRGFGASDRFKTTECTQARREYENEVGSRYRDESAVAARKLNMIKACGMREERRDRSIEFDNAESDGMQQHHVRTITQCDPGGCIDNMGNRYNKSGGSTYVPAFGNGHPCQLMPGGQMHCP